MYSKKLLPLLALAMLAGGCTCMSECPTARFASCGTFVGTLPAADGPGIDTTLVLNSNGSFREHSAYIDRAGIFDEKGTYLVKGDLIELHLNGGQRLYYRAEAGQIRRLDLEGRPITGPLADYYILKQTSPCI